MGEYADMAVDDGVDEYWQFAQGDDADETVGWSPRLRPRVPTPKVCRRCGKTGLHWAMTERGWRLHSLTEIPADDIFEEVEHVCQPKNSAADEAEAAILKAEPSPPRQLEGE